MKEGYFLIFSSMQTEECKMTYKKDCYVKYEAEASTSSFSPLQMEREFGRNAVEAGILSN